MPVKEGDLEFDAYDCDPERWLEFKQDLFRAASGVIDESGSSLLNSLLDTDMGGAAAGAPALPAGAGAAIDVEISLALPSAGDLAFELQVLARAAGGVVNRTSRTEIGAGSIGVNVSASALDGSRKGVQQAYLLF